MNRSHIKKLSDGIYNGVIRGRGIRFIQLINEEKFSCWEFFFPFVLYWFFS